MHISLRLKTFLWWKGNISVDNISHLIPPLSDFCSPSISLFVLATAVSAVLVYLILVKPSHSFHQPFSLLFLLISLFFNVQKPFSFNVQPKIIFMACGKSRTIHDFSAVSLYLSIQSVSWPTVWPAAALFLPVSVGSVRSWQRCATLFSSLRRLPVSSPSRSSSSTNGWEELTCTQTHSWVKKYEEYSRKTNINVGGLCFLIYLTTYLMLVRIYKHKGWNWKHINSYKT